MAARGGGKAAMAAMKGAGGLKLQAAASSSKAQAKGKTKSVAPSSTSELGRFLNIPEPPRSETAKLITKFIKLNNREVSLLNHWFIWLYIVRFTDNFAPTLISCNIVC